VVEYRWSPFQRLALSIYKNRPANIAQVGVCDGKINDPIYFLVKKYIKTNKIILIEPQLDLHNLIRKNYNFHNNKYILNCAIGNPGTLRLYKLNKIYYPLFIGDNLPQILKDAPKYRAPAGFVSSSFEHVFRHLRGNLPPHIDCAKAIIHADVKCCSLAEAIAPADVKAIDILQIDAEGMDHTVIYNANIDRYRPALINFEYNHLSRDGRQQLASYLEAAGYRLSPVSTNGTDLRL